jgi:hypothetical protein
MARNGESKTSGNRIAAAEKQRQALELRKLGVTYAAIAQQLGYAGPSSAEKAVSSALRKTLQEPADELRTLHFLRLEEAWFRLVPKFREGNPAAIRAAISVLQREAKLFGLDAPIRVNVRRVVGEVADQLGLSHDETREAITEIERMLEDARSYDPV